MLFVLMMLLPTRVGLIADDDRFRQVAEQYWQHRLQSDPLFATTTGDHRFNDRLPDVSPEALQRTHQAERQSLEQLQQIDRGTLSPANQLNHTILQRVLTHNLAEFESRAFLIPITNREGFHIYFPELPRQVPLQTTADYENYIARLKQFRRYVADHIELMRAGISKQLVLPSVVLEGHRGQLEPHIVEEASKSLLFAPFTAFPDRISDEDQRRLRPRRIRHLRGDARRGHDLRRRVLHPRPNRRPTTRLRSRHV